MTEVSGEVRCAGCDGTGDLIRFDGEWMGYCTCLEGIRLQRKAVPDASRSIDRATIARAISDPGATEGYKADRTLTEWQTDAVMRALSPASFGGSGKV